MAEAQLAQAKAALQKATDDFNRAKILYSTKSITQPDYDTARKEFEVSEASVAGATAQLEDAKLNLEYCALTAPAKGVLLQRNIEVGTLVRPDTVGFVMADVTSVKVVFGVPDVILGNVLLGSPVGIRTESIPKALFQGKVTAISPAASSTSRVFNVEITVPNPDNLLKIGMIASLEVPGSRASRAGTVVLLSSIVRSKNDSTGFAVFVVDESGGKQVAHLRDVKLAEVYGNTISVTEGLKAGEKVIVSGATLVVEGEQVRIIP
jgi:RND family efflux transporter MFP subunit